jgi:hypothetical protein
MFGARVGHSAARPISLQVNDLTGSPDPDKLQPPFEWLQAVRHPHHTLWSTAFAPSSAMAVNATPSKIAATRGHGAEVVLHGIIWDAANEKVKELVRGFE